MMKNKLGLLGEKDEDEKLITSFLLWMKKNKADYTNTFVSLSKKNALKNDLFKDSVFVDWHNVWKRRLEKNKGSKQSYLLLMQKNNPVVIPRNHNVEKVLKNRIKLSPKTHHFQTPFEIHPPIWNLCVILISG